ncbi:4-hydroxy-3-methylbut-2-enyl diphosphate reductase [Thioalkalivibrio nitratireducens DSM 14787]|uniref:4-hydroxy-3-methylbut-2-enyl diphosphate reductase n=1 Tax=Thioalkalivibrio nitratireducens (strain DSM 14787 / UNIQEM 213 / ALEN2) TaxID=1255043 RepID=L0DQT6_THIND|nr:4-hydroxy-3-methylbut-2-enyl diphosphate reductase [Thioalkalivibrio nitratireducens DSM 14787]
MLLANPRGFCAGVERAIEIVERALELFGAPLYVRHEVVHNRHVVDRLRADGVVFVDELDEVPDGQVVIFSAHGVPKRVQEEAAHRGLRVFDATCPLVTKVHLEVARYAREGREVVLIGHAGHPEVEGTLGQFDPAYGGRMYLVESPEDVAGLEVADPDRLAYVSQTTLSMDDTATVIDALRARFPRVEGPRKMDICYATQNRQDAVKELVRQCDLLLVVGSSNSSNSNRLREIGARAGVEAHLVDGPADVQPAWLQGKQHIGVTAGASAPEILVRELIDFLRAQGAQRVSEARGLEEHVTFSLPAALRRTGPGNDSPS